jgi:hypothetical protein
MSSINSCMGSSQYFKEGVKKNLLLNANYKGPKKKSKKITETTALQQRNISCCTQFKIFFFFFAEKR